MKKDHTANLETWYVRDAAGNVLNYYHRINGSLIQGAHPIYGMGRLGMAFRYPDHIKYNYEFNDHQGNVRQVFTGLKFMATATMETTEPYQSWEEGYAGFANIEETRHLAVPWNTTPEGNKAAWLNPATNGKAIGPAKELKVTQGDTVRMSVMAGYETPASTNTFLPAIGSMIAASFGYSAILGEGGHIHSAIEEAITGFAAVAADGNSTVPKAYLQFLLFDSQMRYIPPTGIQSYVQVSENAANQPELLTLEYIVPKDGYMYIYVANESTNDVNVFLPTYRDRFDDLTIMQTGLHTVEATDYYPFGLVMSRYRTEKYGYGYQSLPRTLVGGQFSEEDEETGWNSFELRQYDPIIARWLSPDPYGQFSSPYLAMGNNPAMVDPDGGFAFPTIDLSFLSDMPAWTSTLSDIVINGGRALEFGLTFTGTMQIAGAATSSLSQMNSLNKMIPINAQSSINQGHLDYRYSSSSQFNTSGGSSINTGIIRNAAWGSQILAAEVDLAARISQYSYQKSVYESAGEFARGVKHAKTLSKWAGGVGTGVSLAVSVYDYSQIQNPTLGNKVQLGTNITIAGLGASAPLWGPFAPVPLVLSAGLTIADQAGYFNRFYNYFNQYDK